ncbi:MAG: hypothetical protein JW779_14190 [Candidatus Thorarchaeota archaeon]|nr:hypothetical protein [Candidatus Thorarchaeota archaeon]
MGGRKIVYDSEQERLEAQRESHRKQREKTCELRDLIFGTECTICGEPREAIHKKDGTPHPQRTLWTRKSLRSLNASDWVALCKNCHTAAHALMKLGGAEWGTIEKMLLRLKDDRGV